MSFPVRLPRCWNRKTERQTTTSSNRTTCQSSIWPLPSVCTSRRHKRLIHWFNELFDVSFKTFLHQPTSPDPFVDSVKSGVGLWKRTHPSHVRNMSLNLLWGKGTMSEQRLKRPLFVETTPPQIVVTWAVCKDGVDCVLLQSLFCCLTLSFLTCRNKRNRTIKFICRVSGLWLLLNMPREMKWRFEQPDLLLKEFLSSSRLSRVFHHKHMFQPMTVVLLELCCVHQERVSAEGLSFIHRCKRFVFRKEK